MKTEKKNNWYCDGRRILKGGCAGQGKEDGGNGAPGSTNWNCAECDFDLCKYCAQAYWNTTEHFIPQPKQSVFGKHDLEPVPRKAYCTFDALGLKCQGKGKDCDLFYGELATEGFYLC